MDKCFHIMQGDSYPIEFAFYDEETGKKITNSEVSKIEFILGNTRKVYPEIGKWDEENEVFLIPFSQEDTFKLREGGTRIQARISFQGEDSVVGCKGPRTIVEDSMSKEIL